MFGTYVRRGEWLLYPFFEYYRDSDLEYAPSEFGIPDDTDYRGRYRASEGLFFIGYGITDDLAVEFEIATISASFEKSSADLSSVPRESRIRAWRHRRAGALAVASGNGATTRTIQLRGNRRPSSSRSAADGHPGLGDQGGHRCDARVRLGHVDRTRGIGYDSASTSALDLGEYAIEYLKRLSPRWRAYVGIEGASDEVSLITEAQWHVSRRVFVRLNNALGLTSKATDWAREIGIVFSVPTSRTPTPLGPPSARRGRLQAAQSR